MRIDAFEKGGSKKRKITGTYYAFYTGKCGYWLYPQFKKISDMVFNNFQVRISVTSVFNHLKLLHYTLKMIKTVPLRRNLGKNVEVRRIYASDFVELDELISPNKIIFLK